MFWKCKWCGCLYEKKNSLSAYCSYNCINSKEKPLKQNKIDDNLKLEKSRQSIIDYHTNKRWYIICWFCWCSSWPFELHHIIYRSEAPRHKNLHNELNLIYLCSDCHRNIHSIYQEFRAHRIISRRLWNIFQQVKMDFFYEIDSHLENISSQYREFKSTLL